MSRIDSPDLAHKTEAGGVRLNLTGSGEVCRAFTAVIEDVGQHCLDIAVRGVLVQKMLQDGLEILVGLKRDEVFGPTVTFGLGGIWVEVMKDVSLRVLLATEEDIQEMIREIKAYPLLPGPEAEHRQTLVP